MPVTLAFDVYGTLIDTHGVIEKLTEIIGDRAPAFSQSWRDKQLEYSFRRGLMQNYDNFAVCTAQALDYCCATYRIELSAEQRETLLASYRTLPAFADTVPGLEKLEAAGYRKYAFSNGSADAVETLLQAAEIRDLFHGVVSVDALKTFKPNPAVYAYFLRESGASGAEAWLISSNPFDVIGAISTGLRAAWVQRSPQAVFDPWGIEPTVIIRDLTELADAIASAN